MYLLFLAFISFSIYAADKIHWIEESTYPAQYNCLPIGETSLSWDIYIDYKKGPYQYQSITTVADVIVNLDKPMASYIHLRKFVYNSKLKLPPNNQMAIKRFWLGNDSSKISYNEQRLDKEVDIMLEGETLSTRDYSTLKFQIKMTSKKLKKSSGSSSDSDHQQEIISFLGLPQRLPPRNPSRYATD